MELKFTPRTVKEIEDRARRPITELMSVVSVSNVALFVEKGAGLSNENQALDAIEKHFTQEGGDLVTLFVTIMEKLQEAGFLPRGIDLAPVKAQISNPESLKKTVDSLVKNGSEGNQPQS